MAEPAEPLLNILPGMKFYKSLNQLILARFYSEWKEPIKYDIAMSLLLQANKLIKDVFFPSLKFLQWEYHSEHPVALPWLGTNTFYPLSWPKKALRHVVKLFPLFPLFFVSSFPQASFECNPFKFILCYFALKEK